MKGKDIGLRSLYWGFNQLRIHNSDHLPPFCFNNRLNTQLLPTLTSPAVKFYSVSSTPNCKDNESNQSKDKNDEKSMSHPSQQTRDYKGKKKLYEVFAESYPATHRVAFALMTAFAAYLLDSWIKERSEQLTALKNIKNYVDEQWLQNCIFLDNLQVLESQPRIYLYSYIDPKELEQHAEHDRWLSRQLELNERLQRNITSFNYNETGYISFISMFNLINREGKNQRQRILRDLYEQNNQLRIAIALNRAVWFHKQKDFSKAEKMVENVIKTLESIKEIKVAEEIELIELVEELEKIVLKRNIILTQQYAGFSKQSLDSLLATAYHIKGKIDRCLASSKRDADGLNKKWLENAKASYEKALKYDEENPIILSSKGRLFADMKELEKALEVYKRANEIRPDNPNILEGLGHCIYQIEKVKGNANKKMDNKELNNSISLLTRGLQLQKNTLLYSRRGVVWRALGKTQNALNDFSEALKIDPFYPRALYQRGKTYLALNQTKRGLSDLNAARAAYINNKRKVKKIDNITNEFSQSYRCSIS